MKQPSITLHATMLDAEGFAFHATIYENEKEIPYKEPWVNLAFTWHKSSYYGTCLKKKTIGQQTYILLSHHEAFEFFLTKPWNTWISFEFSSDCTPYINWAQEIYSHIEADTIQPYYAEDEKGKASLVWGTETNENPDWAKWFQYIIRSVCLSSYTFKPEYFNKYARSYFTALVLNHTSYTDEESFYEKIHWQPKPKPYELAIQLLAPKNEQTDFLQTESFETKLWHLQIMVRPHEPKDVPWLLYEKRHMKQYDFLKPKDHQAIYEKLIHWGNRFPFLRHGQISENRLPIGRSLSEDDAYLFLMEIAPQLVRAQITILLPSWWKDIQKKKWTLQAMVGEEKQTSIMPLVWRDFDWKLAVGNVEISEAEFISALQEGKRFIQVGDEWILLDEQILKDIQTYVKNAKKNGFSLRQMIASEGQAFQNEAIENENVKPSSFHVEMKVTPVWQHAFRQLFTLNSEAEISFENVFNGHLRSYQQVATNWLCDRYNRKLGAVLADDMGLGKTVMVIAYFLYLRGLAKGIQTGKTLAKERKTPILLICPTSLLGNWETELEKFAPKLQVRTHYGANRAKTETDFFTQLNEIDIVLTSYGLVSNDFSLLSSITWQSIALDEAQNIKNDATKQSRAIRDLPALHRIALTGTPVENRLLELWTLFDFIQPDYLGGMTAFKQDYIVPIEENGDKKKQQALKVLIQPFLLRRTKKDKDIRLDLPDKLEQKSFLHLNIEQATLYYHLVEKCKESRDETHPLKQKGLILSALNHFKMICNHPALYLGETTNHNWMERSPKLSHCLQLVETILEQNEQALIFTQYIEMAKILQFALQQQFDLDVPFFHGGLHKNARDQLVADFQNHKSKIMILSLKAGGTGLTLTAANHVIHFDRWWNPAVENQATDRVHRIGQKNFVHVHKLIMKGTIEEKIDALMDKKQDLSDQILSPESWLSQMSFDDFLQMVGS